MANNTPKWTGYFKVVDATPTSTKMTDSQEMSDVGAYNNYTWYQRLIQGSASRMTRYREYDLMDNDIEISRAIDTIAEEMTGNNPKTKDPIEIHLIAEQENNIESTAVLTLKAALRRWVKIHDLNNRLYKISRHTIKYGDIFFERQENPFLQWIFIHPKNVVAAIVSANDATKIIGWQVKSDIKKPRSGGYAMPLGAKEDTQTETRNIRARNMIRFSLSDDMSDTQPFGESVLRPVYRSHKQKELLEDAVIIYRVQRAPERRVFYIDVGKMPPNRVKQYLENIKNEIKQKKVPTLNGGQSEIDSVYNPQSMCLSLDTKIPLLDGRTLTLNEMISEHNAGKENWVYSINPNTGEYVPGMVSWAGVTRKNTETVKLTLDNGDEIVCTPDHHFFVQGHGYERIKAKDLTPEHSLWPFQSKLEQIRADGPVNNAKYTQIYNPATKSWKFVHRMVANYMRNAGQINEMVHKKESESKDKRVIHHKNFSAIDNSPNNLAWMNSQDHSAYHLELNPNQAAIFPDEMVQRFIELANKDIYVKFKDLMVMLNEDETFMSSYASANQKQENKKYKLKTDTFRQKMFLVFIKHIGFKNWKEYQQHVIQSGVDIEQFIQKARVYDKNEIKLIQCLLNLIKTKGIHNFKLVNYLKDNPNEWKIFCETYENVFKSKFQNRYKKLSVPEASMFERIAKYFGYDNLKHLVAESSNFNHRVVKIEEGPLMDTGTLTIDRDHIFHDYHNFVIQTSNDNNELHGIVTANSEDFFFASRPDGRSSRVETLPGGQGLGELADLEYFQRKVWRGLKVPVSYMIEQQEGGQIWNDGKVGIAYIQELRFSLYVERLQRFIEKTLDKEFKRFLKNANINISEDIYELKLPEPSNYGKYRQYELDSQLLGAYSSAEAVKGLSTRFKLSRFLQLTDEELKMSEFLKCEELGLDPNGNRKEILSRIYGSDEDGMGGGGFGGGGFGGGGFGGGMGGTELGMEAGGDMGDELSGPEGEPASGDVGTGTSPGDDTL